MLPYLTKWSKNVEIRSECLQATWAQHSSTAPAVSALPTVSPARACCGVVWNLWGRHAIQSLLPTPFIPKTLSLPSARSGVVGIRNLLT